MPTLRRITTILVVGVAAVGIAGCGDDDDDEEGGGSATTTAPAETAGTLPSEFTGEFLQIREGTQSQPRVVGARLEAADGTKADASFEMGGRPAPPSGSVQCGGETFEQGSTDDAPATGRLRITGLGTAALAVEQTVTVVEGPPPPVCDERTGTWTGNGGELDGRSGTFTMVARHPDPNAAGDSTLTLEEE